MTGPHSEGFRRIDGVIGKLRYVKISIVIRQSDNRNMRDPMITCSVDKENVAD